MSNFELHPDPCEVLGLNWEDLVGKSQIEARRIINEAARPKLRDLHPDINSGLQGNIKAIRELEAVIGAKTLLGNVSTRSAYLHRMRLLNPQTSTGQMPGSSRQSNDGASGPLGGSRIPRTPRMPDFTAVFERDMKDLQTQTGVFITNLPFQEVEQRERLFEYLQRLLRERRAKRDDREPRNGIKSAETNLLLSRSSRGDNEALRTLVNTTDFNSKLGIRVIQSLFDAKLLPPASLAGDNFGTTETRNIGGPKLALEIMQKLDLSSKYGQKTALMVVDLGLVKSGENVTKTVLESDSVLPDHLLADLIHRTDFNSQFGVLLTEKLISTRTIGDSYPTTEAVEEILRKVDIDNCYGEKVKADLRVAKFIGMDDKPVEFDATMQHLTNTFNSTPSAQNFVQY